MNNKRTLNWAGLTLLIGLTTACNVPRLVQKTENRMVPASFNNAQDSTNSAKTTWREFFTDPNLTALIDTALYNNQELNITLQEIQVSNNEVLARTGAYRPTVSLGGGAGLDKVSRYTSQGAADDYTEIRPGRTNSGGSTELLFRSAGDLGRWISGANCGTPKKSAVYSYLASVEGKNFQITNLVSEIATNYYELLAYDNQLDIIRAEPGDPQQCAGHHPAGEGSS